MKTLIQKFKSALKKEFLLYLIMLFVLAFIMHSDLLSNPSSRFETMYEKGNYTHPFLYTFFIYSIILIIRKTLDLIIALFEKKKDS